MLHLILFQLSAASCSSDNRQLASYLVVGSAETLNSSHDESSSYLGRRIGVWRATIGEVPIHFFYSHCLKS